MTKKWFLLKVLYIFIVFWGSVTCNEKTVLANEYTIVDENTVVYKDLVTGETGCLEYQKDNCSIAAFSSNENIYYETLPCIPANILIEKTSEIVPYGVIGDDDRRRIHDTTKFPSSAVVHLDIYWKNGKYSRGTAFMVNKTQAITAGHCLYNAENGGFANSVTLSAGENGIKYPFGSTWAKKMYIGGFSLSTTSDWGVIDIGGSFEKFPGYFGVTYTTKNLKCTHVTTRGYPGQYAKLMYTSSGYINLDDNKGELLFQIDITGGQSGSPLYKSNHSVIGIVTSEVSKNGTYIYNIGTKITEPLFIKIGGKLPTGGEFTDGGGFSDGSSFTSSKKDNFGDGSGDFSDGNK